MKYLLMEIYGRLKLYAAPKEFPAKAGLLGQKQKMNFLVQLKNWWG